jgi:hypothetical protein
MNIKEIMPSKMQSFYSSQAIYGPKQQRLKELESIPGFVIPSCSGITSEAALKSFMKGGIATNANILSFRRGSYNLFKISDRIICVLNFNLKYISFNF